MLKALIIDDEMDICFLLGKMLEKKSVDSQYANSLVDAASLLKYSAPDIVFLDNHLSDGRGLDFVGYIKDHNPLAKIIMISAYDNISDRKSAKKIGVDDFIGKPFSLDSIETALATLGQAS